MKRALVLALALGALAPGQATAHHVDCGDTITVDTRLDSDLTDCPGTGIAIGAEGITLDLNGHRVEGHSDEYTIGIDNRAGHDGVTIENGTVRGFVEGVVVAGDRNRVRRLSATQIAHGGVVVGHSAGSRVERSSFADVCAGVIVFASRRARVEHNTVSDNTCGGIPLFQSEHVRVAHNSIAAGDTPGEHASGDANGIGLFDGSHRNQVEHNTITGHGWVGLVVEHGDGNEVRANRIVGNNGGLVFDGDRNRIVHNTVTDAVGACDGCGLGISFEGGRGNLIEGNTVERTREAGIRLAAFEPFTSAAVGNTARLNVVREARLDGILVESTATDSVLERNSASRNRDDGIDVERPETVLTGNTADANRDLGIEAVEGVTDGGGNRARGNGNPLQCANVFCK